MSSLPAAALEPGLASDLTGSPGCQFGRAVSPTLGACRTLHYVPSALAPGRRWSSFDRAIDGSAFFANRSVGGSVSGDPGEGAEIAESPVLAGEAA